MSAAVGNSGNLAYGRGAGAQRGVFLGDERRDPGCEVVDLGGFGLRLDLVHGSLKEAQRGGRPPQGAARGERQSPTVNHPPGLSSYNLLS